MVPPDSKPSDRKLTEDLLAGVDRTGRTPRTPPVTKDFVDFHREPVARRVSPPRAVEPTFVIRPRRGMPVWLIWVGTVALMLVGGASVAWLIRPATVATPAPLPTFALPAPPAVATSAASAGTPVVVEALPAPAATETPPAPSARPRPAAPKSGFLREL